MISLGIGVSWIRKTTNLLSRSIVYDFKSRVTADGGTFEAGVCMQLTIDNLLRQPQTITTFKLRVLADGGGFEAETCMQATVDGLKNININ
jgi:hypothetical protein